MQREHDMTLRKGLFLSAAALGLAGAIAVATPADARGGGSAGGGLGGSVGAMGHMGGASNATVPASSLNGGGNTSANAPLPGGRDTRAGGSLLSPENGGGRMNTIGSSVGDMNGSPTITGSHIPMSTGSNAVVPAASLNGGGNANAAPNVSGGRGTRAGGSMLSPDNGSMSTSGAVSNGTNASGSTNASGNGNGVNAAGSNGTNSRFGLSGRSGNLSTAGFANTNGRFAAHRTFGHERAALRHALHHHHHMRTMSTSVNDNDADDRGTR
jgi:hypothetical protein